MSEYDIRAPTTNTTYDVGREVSLYSNFYAPKKEGLWENID